MDGSKVLYWLIAALVRAVKTAAQTAVALIGTELVATQIAAVCATAFVLSVLTSVAGVPEVQEGESLPKLAKEAK